eukprot:SAG31_NODE_1074_length_10052_cov_88.255400_2_plen_84_part_00
MIAQALSLERGGSFAHGQRARRREIDPRRAIEEVASELGEFSLAKTVRTCVFPSVHTMSFSSSQRRLLENDVAAVCLARGSNC